MAKSLKEVIDGDFRRGDCKSDAEEWLLKIPALRKRTQEGEKVKLEDIEKLIFQITKKYKIQMQWIELTFIDGEIPWYSVSIKDGQTHEYLKTVYGLTIHELFTKVALFMFAKTRVRGKDGK